MGHIESTAVSVPSPVADEPLRARSLLSLSAATESGFGDPTPLADFCNLPQNKGTPSGTPNPRAELAISAFLRRPARERGCERHGRASLSIRHPHRSVGDETAYAQRRRGRLNVLPRISCRPRAPPKIWISSAGALASRGSLSVRRANGEDLPRAEMPSAAGCRLGSARSRTTVEPMGRACARALRNDLAFLHRLRRIALTSSPTRGGGDRPPPRTGWLTSSKRAAPRRP
jgi:hypothetical protein